MYYYTFIISTQLDNGKFALGNFGTEYDIVSALNDVPTYVYAKKYQVSAIFFLSTPQC